MAYIIATANMKGGVGKTTLTVNLAACLAKYHQKRVLVVDLDSQISATLSLMQPSDFAKRRKENRTLRHIFSYMLQAQVAPGRSLGAGQAQTVTAPPTASIIAGYIGNIKGLDLLPGDIELYDEFLVSEHIHLQTQKQNNTMDFAQTWHDFESQLIRQILQPVMADYDFIILDCAPGYNLLTRSGLLASDFYVLPARPEPLSVIGIQLLQRRIDRLRESHSDHAIGNMQLLGIVFTMLGNVLTGRYYRRVMARVREDFNDSQLFHVRVPSDIKVAQSVDRYLPVSLTDPDTAAAKVFRQLTQELLHKLNQSVGSASQQAKLNLMKLE